MDLDLVEDRFEPLGIQDYFRELEGDRQQLPASKCCFFRLGGTGCAGPPDVDAGSDASRRIVWLNSADDCAFSSIFDKSVERTRVRLQMQRLNVVIGGEVKRSN